MNFGSKYPEMGAFDPKLVSDSAGCCGWPGWRAGRTTLAARFVFTPVARGEWRNGRRAGFRCQWAQARGGSTPLSPTFLSTVRQVHQRCSDPGTFTVDG